LEEIAFWNHRFSGGNVDICWSENALVTDGCVGDIVHRRVSLYRQRKRLRVGTGQLRGPLQRKHNGQIYDARPHLHHETSHR
jgi:hypothetical protein